MHFISIVHVLLVNVSFSMTLFELVPMCNNEDNKLKGGNQDDKNGGIHR